MPPGSKTRPRNETAMIRHIINSLDFISSKYPQTGFIVTGDFNKMKDNQLKQYPLKQIVTTPTHENAILDCIYTNMAPYYQQPSIHPGLGLSRHEVVLCHPNNKQPNTDTVTRVTRVNSTNAKSLFKMDLSNIDWTPLYQMKSCTEQYAAFLSTLTHLLDTHLPEKEVTRFTTDKPWITTEYKTLIQKRQIAYKARHQHRYRLLRNKVNRLGKTLRGKYYRGKVQQLKSSNPKDWWKKTKAFIGITQQPNQELENLAHEITQGNKKDLANQINRFFTSISSEINPLLPLDSQEPLNVPDKYIIRQDQVERALMSTNQNKAIGPDEIPNWIIRDLGPLIAGPICAIYNSSIRESVIPKDWKSANVVPIPKCHPPKNIQNDLRPISLTPVLAKHLETFIGNWILEAIENKMDKTQFGAIKGLSTTHTLIDLLHKWHTCLHKGQSIRAVFLDFSKAFDRVDHNLLIEKFRKLDVPETLLRWLHAFLSDRKQRVKINKDISEWLSPNGGMPQGSWLGPLCFITYISDLKISNLFHIHKYMDDTTITEALTPQKPSEIHKAVSDITNWC